MARRRKHVTFGCQGQHEIYIRPSGKRSKNGERRYRKQCTYYMPKNQYCMKLGAKCVGAAVCEKWCKDRGAENVVQKKEFAREDTMAEKKLGGLAGTPWHVGYVTKEEDDPRRDRRRCQHYSTKNGHCSVNVLCYGSAHCRQYRERAVEHKKEKARKESVGWKSASLYIRDPGIVQILDDVVLYCFDDSKEHTLHIDREPENQPPLAKACLSRKKGDAVEHNGYRYRIVQIKKAKDIKR